MFSKDFLSKLMSGEYYYKFKNDEEKKWLINYLEENGHRRDYTLDGHSEVKDCVKVYDFTNEYALHSESYIKRHYKKLTTEDTIENPTYDDLKELFIDNTVNNNIYLETENINSVVFDYDDKVNRPSHYVGENGIEVEDILQGFVVRYEDGYVAHRVASAIEYLLRSPKKNGLEDIKKAKKNLEQVIDYIEE